MTINVQLREIVTAISNISVQGVNVKDLNKIPEDASELCPIFFPNPDGFITDMAWSPESFGADNVRKMNLEYTLNYRYLHAPVGGTGDILSAYEGLVVNVIAILEAIFADSTPDGSIDMTLQGITELGSQTDIADQLQYHGVDIALRVLEYIQ